MSYQLLEIRQVFNFEEFWHNVLKISKISQLNFRSITGYVIWRKNSSVKKLSQNLVKWDFSVNLQTLMPSFKDFRDNKNNPFWQAWEMKRIFMTFVRNEKMFRPLNRNWEFLGPDSIFAHPTMKWPKVWRCSLLSLESR